MLRSVGSFLASVEDIWDVGAIAVVAAFTAFIGHMVANVWMVWTVEMAEAADQGKSLMDNGVTVWSDCLFKTGFYAYDVQALELNKSGEPSHPLYLPNDTEPFSYEPEYVR